ncbi:cyclic nucleotide-binding protein [Stagnimonas aquatica]|uniref:Cyclic nucleotide-binding protein n=1 Tax=Stagnimonas aquatica TaxID=2689987 RepID=A0A3N0V1M0_9GAMM|nr:cyclic nucleotide-binding and patatin-like phospholipase domain-containing protein [Stagnimonas aquatica]ROH86502.1 cyclic nucleotide-binding protein [Stagnimonas aquatica]
MEARSTLAECELFLGLEPAALDTLAACAKAVTVRGGETLFSAGDDSDALYIVATGRLRAVLPSGEVAGDIARLEPIGEIGVLSGEVRGASVHALRDSLLWRFSSEAFYAFVLDHPAALVAVARVIVARLRQNSRSALLAKARRTRTFAVVAATPDLDASALARSCQAALGQRSRCLLIDAARVDAALGAGASGLPPGQGAEEGRLMAWLNAVEAEHDYLVFDAGHGDAAWSLRALRQADRVLVLADANAQPAPSRMLEALARASVRTPVDCVLLRPAGAAAIATSAWCQALHASGHYYLRPGVEADVHALVRQLTGRGLGLVLGGGGARGFAHIGLLRALSELQLPADLIGGTSMGAFVSALHACGHDHATILQITRDTFVSRNLLNDYMLPRVALIGGRKLRKRLLEVFGDVQIEQLRMPYYCVSTNLTRGTAVVHDRGPLAAWVGTSMCIPGVAPPVAWRGDLLADGAVVNSLPTDVMQNLARGPIIASDVSTEGSIAAPGVEGPDFEAVLRAGADGRRVGLLDILFRTSTLTSESGVRRRAECADLYLRMPVGGIQTFDWKSLDAIVEKGYRHAMARLPEIAEQLRG